MQINGLKRDQATSLKKREEATGGALSQTHKHPRGQGFRRILLVAGALDNDPGALDLAYAMADRSEGEIVLLKASSPKEGVQDLAGHARCLLQAYKVDLLEVDGHHLDAASVDQVARRYACDLVIIGMESQSDGLRTMKGSIAEGVFRRLKCPTMLLGSRAMSVKSEECDGPTIFATSFQDRNMAAIGLASRVANLYGSALECVHVLPVDMAESIPGCHVVPQIMRNALIEGARQNHIAVRPEQCHILYGSSVSDAVVRFAALHKARFIVLGAQQTGPAASHLPPGIVSRVVQSALCAVLILTTPMRQDSIPSTT